MNKYEASKDIINHARQIVVFTGAGISVPSGIPDFRSSEGIYNQETNLSATPEDIISHSFYEKHPEEFFEFYKTKMCYPEAQPNEAHKYLARLEKQGKNVIIITQNIDGLHQKAGSNLVYELHGNIHRNYCEKCSRMYGLEYVMNAEGVPHCDKCGATIKPDVVLYEEELDQDIINRSISAIMTCDVLLVIGTSLSVYPAAGFIRYFKGDYIVIINKERTRVDDQCDLVFNEDVVEVIKKL